MKTGILTGEPIEQYHSSDAISSSKLKTFMDDPYIFYCRYIAKTLERESSNALELGQSVHRYILENHEIKAEDLNKRTKNGRETYEFLKSQFPDAIICNTEESSQIIKMAESVEETLKNNGYYEDLNAFRSSCSVETTYRALLKRGVCLQCRPDAINDDILFDLKTTQDIESFERDVWKFKYHIQAGFYFGILSLLSLNPRPFKFIAVEKKDPYRSGIFSFTAEQCQYFWESFCKPKLVDLIKCLDSNEWIKRYGNEKLIDIPDWIML
jgi:exodeoxyribonuclease VIII